MTTELLQTAVIINMKARQTQAVQEELKKECEHLHVKEKDIYCIEPEKINAAIQDKKDDGYQRIIIGGGDGTITSAARILAHTSIQLGIIPLGTSNNIARSLNISSNWKEAIQQISGGKVQKVHLAQINGIVYFNVASFGVSTYIARHVSNINKRIFGRFAYLATGIRLFFIHKPFVCTIKTPKEIRKIVTHEVVIANGRYHGGKEISEEASLTKPTLTVFAFGTHRSRLEHLWNMLLYGIGLHGLKDDMLIFETQKVEITTDPSKPIEADGEEVTQTPVTASVITNALQVIVPK